MKILFTCVGRRVELIQCFKAAAKRLNVSLEIIGADNADDAPALFFCDKKIKIPKIKEINYIESLLKICADEKVDALIPTIDTDLMLLAAHKKLFEEIGTRAIISAEDKIAICRDKRKTADYFRKLGLLTPDTFDNAEQYNAGYPAFIKPLDGSSSISAYRINTVEELRTMSNIVPDYIIQPCISGREYTVDAFCNLDGEPVYITPRIRLAVRSGEVLKTEITHDAKIIGETKKILSDFKPVGAITIQLIRNADGDDYFIEINPRYGGGAPLSIKAGADSAEALIKILSGSKTEYVENAAENGAVYSRFDQAVRVR